MKNSLIIKMLGRDSGSFKVTQVRSIAGRSKDIKDTISALGLGKIGKSKEFQINPALIGMVDKVRHLVSVE